MTISNISTGAVSTALRNSGMTQDQANAVTTALEQYVDARIAEHVAHMTVQDAEPATQGVPGVSTQGDPNAVQPEVGQGTNS